MSALLDLAARCEAASGPDRALDKAILAALGFTWRGMAYWSADDKTMWKGGVFLTACLDAAMTLVPEGWGWAIDHPSIQLARRITNGAVVGAETYNGKGLVIQARAATPALALCAAALKARAAIADRNRDGEDPAEGLRAKHESGGSGGNRTKSSTSQGINHDR